MTPRFRGKIKRAYIYVPKTPQHSNTEKATGTSDTRLIRRMEAMLKQLKNGQNWAVLNLLHEDRFDLAAVFDAYQRNALDALVARATAVDLFAHIDPWLASYRADGKSASNAANYKRQVEAFVTPGMLITDVTPGAFRKFLTDLDVSSGTRRHYLMAMKSFIRYCREAGLFTIDPLHEFRAPKKNPPRKRWASVATDTRIVQAATSAKMRCLFALVHGTGADLGAIVTKCRRADIDLGQGVVVVRATKTGHRDRHAIIEPWAIPYMEEHLATLLPGALVFEDWNRFWPSEHHRDLGAKLQPTIEDYTLRDARHSIAIRMLRAGQSYDDVAAQLGTSVWQVVHTYSKRDITLEERLSNAKSAAQNTAREGRANVRLA